MDHKTWRSSELHWAVTELSSSLRGAGEGSAPFTLVRTRSDLRTADHALLAISERNRHLELRNRQLLLEIEELTHLANIDSLTGLANRRCFEDRLSSEIRRAQRSNTPLALALCDVDSFKHLNDTLGHQSGDDVLRRIGHIMRRYGRRGGDLAARYGGDEFALLLPATSCREAFGIAERIRRLVSCSPMRFGASKLDRSISVSMGVTIYPGEGVCEQTDVVRAADVALYEAKNTGANRTKYQGLNR